MSRSNNQHYAKKGECKVQERAPIVPQAAAAAEPPSATLDITPAHPRGHSPAAEALSSKAGAAKKDQLTRPGPDGGVNLREDYTSWNSAR
jgi:hypothetical protein